MLYIVSTPIGNLADITLRALDCLKECDYILCEDTRHSLKLLAHYQIHTPLFSFHPWNEAKQEEKVLADLQQGKKIALISDAGTPLIADPGYRLVKKCREEKLPYTALPGPCAVICALTLSGFATQPFQFVGFLPRKNSEVIQTLETLFSYPGTSICYESPERIRSTLQHICQIDPSRQILLARELTKRFETILCGTAEQVLQQEKETPALGEIVLLIEGQILPMTEQLFSQEFLCACVEEVMRTQDCSKKTAIALVSQQLHVPKNVIYNAAHL